MEGKHFIIAGAAFMLLAMLFISISGVNIAEALPGKYSGGSDSGANSAGGITGNVASGNTGTGSTTTTTSAPSGDYQEVKLSMKNYKYVIEPSVLKKGVPVRMTVDTNTVVGCAADVTIREFGVRKYVRSGDNVITFTPTKTGNILVACSMNMYFGSFQVVDDANPDAAPEVDQTVPEGGGSCGAEGGGCGCGG